MKIAIVGPEEKKWTKDQEVKARGWISVILASKESSGKLLDEGKTVKVELEAGKDYSGNILVSGHCHKGGVDIWAEEMAKSIGCYDSEYIFPAEVHGWNDKKICSKCYDIQGAKIDQWIADEKWCYWHGQNCQDKGKEITLDMFVTKMGYRSRNIKIAEACDVLYCIVPKVMVGFNVVPYNRKCYCTHCGEWGHPNNGGCWTMKYAKKIGKETHLVVID